MPMLSNITFNNVSTSDWVSLKPLMEFNSSGSILQGLIIDNSQGGSLAALQVDAGSLKSCSVRGATNITSFEVTDGTGNPIGACLTSNTNGLESIVDEQIGLGPPNGGVLHSDLFSQFGYAPGVRVTASGNRFAGVALDGLQGLLLNDTVDFGFGASINQTGRGRIDFSFPTLYPPTNVAGTPTTGGSIAPGTYYITMWSTNDGCANSWSAPSLASSGVTLSGSNNAISATWTTPLLGTSASNGFCAVLSPVPNLSGGVGILLAM